MPEHASSVTRLEMVCHTGTHLDAPSHFVPGAPAIDEIPLARLSGPGVVVRAHVDADGDHTCLSEEAAWSLVEHGVKLVATDLPTPDLASCRSALR